MFHSKTIILTTIIFLLSIGTVNSATSPQPTGINAVFLSQTNQLISPNCYNVQVRLNVTDFNSSLFHVSMNRFYLFEQAPNLEVRDQSYYQKANNTLTDLILFPSNPLIIDVTFANFCLVPIANPSVWLFYDNGFSSYRTKIFP